MEKMPTGSTVIEKKKLQRHNIEKKKTSNGENTVWDKMTKRKNVDWR
jgi:hypothetical protein